MSEFTMARLAISLPFPLMFFAAISGKAGQLPDTANDSHVRQDKFFIAGSTIYQNDILSALDLK
jgi:hypothetical protein